MSGVQRFVVAEDSLAPRSVVGDKEYAGCVDVVLAADHARIAARDAELDGEQDEPDFGGDGP